MKSKLITLRNKFLTKMIDWLQYLIIQITKSGVKSQFYNYIYQEHSQQYISNIDDLDYPKMTEKVENAIDFSQYWFRKLILWKLNVGLNKYEKFRFRNFIKLYGGNFGMKTNISIGTSSGDIVSGDKSLADIDSLNMDDM